ncbi:hypothetical protein AQJ11_02775 [Streptomyces corchorusii]|uniref:Uncharacterized protein n=2 Tax=Streptomyces TaxID=1883 RepID=A0A101QM51_STRCK|nr:hypothetical protein [Streptomyces corchorusii]KUN32467.1 hypothetical protein AQJ11_02775 [Streptomyces corchorusii]
MNTALDVLIWIAENLSWWWLLILAPGVLGGGWLWLRPTGKHRRTQPDQPAEAARPAVDEDTLTFQRVTYPGLEADS